MDIRYAEMIKWVRHNHKDKLNRLLDSLAPNQIKGKSWLVKNLDRVQIPRDKDGKFRVEIIGGWFGFPLIQFLIEKYGDEIREIDLFEIDEFATKTAWKYSEIFGYNNIRIFHKDYFLYEEKRRTHMIINTSCEHMWNMDTMKEYYESPERTLLVLQSNNKRDEPDHINCVDHPKQLVAQANMHQLYGGAKELPCGENEYFTRFMAMGKWK